jgi:hypothetical protein
MTHGQAVKEVPPPKGSCTRPRLASHRDASRRISGCGYWRAADRPALGRAYLARRKTHGSAAAADHRRTLESREIDPPAGFVRLQVARISQAIIVAHTMTMEGKFQAIDRVLELAGELERSHGFVQA